jgi:aspartate/methionine/tyrosine aminotransferase
LGNTASEQLKEDCLRRRDYDTISVGVLDDHFAALALANKGKIFARNRAIVDKNRAILDAWVQATPEVYYQKPQAGTTALVY